MENPYQSPEAFERAELNEVGPTEKMPGIRRLPFWGILIALRITEVAIIFSMQSQDFFVIWPAFVTLIFLFVYIYPVYSRLKNLGSNPLWSLLAIIPIVNLFLFVRCLIFPEGYALTKKLDTAAKVMSVLVAVTFIVAVGLVVITLLNNA